MPTSPRLTCRPPRSQRCWRLSALAAVAQDYPTRPVRLIIPFPPGGSNDVVGRMIATKLGEKLGKQMVVDNRGGAGGVVGTEAAVAAPPDGYTLLVISLAHAVNPVALQAQVRQPEVDHADRAGRRRAQRADRAPRPCRSSTVKDLLDYARKNPGKLNVAHAGIGSFQHLGSSLFLVMTKLDIVLVPFKGGGPAMIDVIAGHSQVTMGSLVQTTGHIKSGKLKALGVGGLKRVAILPDLPTIAEAGVPGYEANNWWGIVGPAGLPKAIVDKLARRHRRRAGHARAEGRFRQGRRRDRQDGPGRLREVHRDRAREMGEGGQRGQHQGRIDRCQTRRV